MTNPTPSSQLTPAFSDNVYTLDLGGEKKVPLESTEGIDVDDAQIPGNQEGHLTEGKQASDDDDIVGPDGNRG